MKATLDLSVRKDKRCSSNYSSPWVKKEQHCWGSPLNSSGVVRRGAQKSDIVTYYVKKKCFLSCLPLIWQKLVVIFSRVIYIRTLQLRW